MKNTDKTLMRVTATDYEVEDGEVLVQLTGRDEYDNRRPVKVTGTIPYFYVRDSEADKVEDHEGVRSIDYGYESFDGISVARINLKTPKYAGNLGQVENLTERFDDHWEADIPFYRRVSIDYNLSGHILVPDGDKVSIDDIETDVTVTEDEIIEPKVLIADIEVLPKDGVDFDEMTEEYNSPVSHISMWDSKEDEYVALHLDPDGRVSAAEVSSLLDEHTGIQRLSSERERDIHLRSYETEESLLDAFLSEIESRQPDLVSGWNWIDFDWDYLLGRFDQLDDLNEHRLSDIGWVNGYQTERKVDCLPAFDMMDAYCEKMTFSEFRSKRLDYVAKKELGVGKMPNISITEDFDDRRDELLAYNIIDTMLCVALDRKEGVHEFFYELAELSQIQIYDTFSEMRLVDGYLIHQADDTEILPSMPDDQDIPENAGGLVLSPSDGVKEWVGVLDLKSLYPSSIITWNISPETIHWYEDEKPTGRHLNIPWLPDADTADGGQFGYEDINFDIMWTDLSEEGLVPKYLKRLFPEREKFKSKRNQYEPDDPEYDVWDRKQAAVKVIMNSFYGVMSMDYWRLAMYGLGDAVTSTSRYSLWQGKEIAESEGKKVYYGDTDSIMLSLAASDEGKQAALTRGKALEETVNARMDECLLRSGMGEGETHPFIGDELHGTDRHCLVYEFEKLYRRFFQAGSKKRYAGRIVWKEGKDVDGDIDMVGFESKRSDSPELTSIVQPKVVNMILSGDGFNEVSEYVRGLISDFDNRDLDMYKVAIPGSLNQPLHEYGNTQVAKACRFSNKILGKTWSKGDDPWIYFVDKTPPMIPGTEVIALDWDEDPPEEYELDDDAIFDRALKAPLLPILREVNWRWKEVKQGSKTQSASEANWTVEDNDDDNDVDEWGW